MHYKTSLTSIKYDIYYKINFPDFTVSSFGLATSANSYKRKRERSDSVLWQKPLHPQKNTKSNMTTQKRHQKLRLHNDCAPTYDGQLK